MMKLNVPLFIANCLFLINLFDEQDWDIRINLKCVNNLDGTEICSLVADRNIRKDENIVFVREGWGVKTPGSYWKGGNYRWEAWIDSVFVSEKIFYVEDQGIVSETVNPYFGIQQIKLYEGPDSNVSKKDRKYMVSFNSKETRYVWVELTAENIIKNKDTWACELFFNFRTHSGQLKGSIDKIFQVNTKEGTFECSIGWGADQKGTWGNDIYSVDIVFMDQIITTVPFEVGDSFSGGKGYSQNAC
jgi:hypothetical protein